MQRRVIWGLAATQSVAGIATSIGIASSGLAVSSLAGLNYGGLGQTLLLVGTLLGAILVARAAIRGGRRLSLSSGYSIACAGAALSAWALMHSMLVLLFVALLALGFGAAASFSSRYAAMDIATPARRSRDASIVIFATAGGSLIGPLLAGAVGVPTDIRTSLAIGYAIAALAFFISIIAVQWVLRDDPLLLARQLALVDDQATSAPTDRRLSGGTLRRILSHSNARFGMAGVIAAHSGMVGLMAAGPLHIVSHGGSLADSSLMISIHLAGMYFFTPIMGLLVDRLGSKIALCASLSLMLVATVLIVFLSETSGAVIFGMFLIGVAWSGSMLAGSSLLIDSVTADDRPVAQGVSDVSMDVAAVLLSLSVGITLNSFGIQVVAALVAAIVLAASLTLIDRKAAA